MGEIQDVATSIRGSGGRLTRPRQALWDALNGSRGHVSAEQLLASVNASLPKTALSTVYRTLALLEEQGLAHHVMVGGEALYGPISTPHHHAVCEVCGNVTQLDDDIVAPIVNDLRMVAALTPASTAKLTIYGLCSVCDPGDNS